MKLFSGDASLKNLQIKPDAFSKLNLPITIKEGTLQKLSISIPWTSLKSQSVKIYLEDLHILVVSKRNYYQEEREKEFLERELETKLHMLMIHQLIQSEEEQKSTNSSFLQNLIETIIGNIQIKIKNVHLRYEDNLSNEKVNFTFFKLKFIFKLSLVSLCAWDNFGLNYNQ